MTYLLRLTAYLFLCVSLNSFGALSIRDLDSDWSNGHEAVYDDVFDITWLQDANHGNVAFTWQQAMSWANDFSYQGFTEWRLPSTSDTNALGVNHTTNEIGHLSYVVLNNPTSMTNLLFIDAETGEIESFLASGGQYLWLKESGVGPTAYMFNRGNGHQINGYTGNGGYAWAVHDGDIGASPVPLPTGITLFLSGLVGLGLIRGKTYGC